MTAASHWPASTSTGGHKPGLPPRSEMRAGPAARGLPQRQPLRRGRRRRAPDRLPGPGIRRRRAGAQPTPGRPHRPRRCPHRRLPGDAERSQREVPGPPMCSLHLCPGCGRHLPCCAGLFPSAGSSIQFVPDPSCYGRTNGQENDQPGSGGDRGMVYVVKGAVTKSSRNSLVTAAVSSRQVLSTARHGVTGDGDQTTRMLSTPSRSGAAPVAIPRSRRWRLRAARCEVAAGFRTRVGHQQQRRQLSERSSPAGSRTCGRVLEAPASRACPGGRPGSYD
jgi:hypothetical protein